MQTISSEHPLCLDEIRPWLDSLPVKISSIATDSRQVQAGTLFCAVKGNAQDGVDYIPQALAQGATAILTRVGVQVQLPDGVAHRVVENDRLATACLASAFYQPQPPCIVAITGTDGKTSTADFFRQLMESCGKKAASLGTLGLKSTTVTVDAPALNTSPDPITLHQTLQKIAHQGGEYLAVEASSHGLTQYRLHGLHLQAAAFTNLGRDHLDYHTTLEDYFSAKMKLFTELLPAEGTAVIFRDDARAKQVMALCQQRGQRVITYGTHPEADFRVVSWQPEVAGITADLQLCGISYPAISLQMIGDFQLFNVLAAMGLAIGCGFTVEALVPHLSRLRSVRGRLELAGKTPLGAAIYVDYAHTPAALEKALTVMRRHTTAKLSVVFGCGGDRDKGKRPEMGAVACRLADRVYLADDNPRSENPATIRTEIMAGCSEKAQNIGERRAAITQAMADLQAGDILLLAGKGHETTQIIGLQTLHFDDREEVQQLLTQLEQTVSEKL
jgi:UDP-N-acetylmuramoyl-L-alanyl-D-glutamate--2,6-diaminopimelate ligase